MSAAKDFYATEPDQYGQLVKSAPMGHNASQPIAQDQFSTPPITRVTQGPSASTRSQAPENK